MTSKLDIDEARRIFSELDDHLRSDPIIWITRQDKKAFAVVGTELLESVLETIEILADQPACEMIQRSLEDIRSGRLKDHADVKRELLG